MINDEQEMNKKLAKWVGFEYKEIPYSTPFGKAIEPKWFHIPTAYDEKTPPDFTQSLGACFGWLETKLREEHSDIKISLMNMDSKFFCSLNYYGKESSRKKNFHWVQLSGARGDSYAEAFCLAIEKITDKESVNALR